MKRRLSIAVLTLGVVLLLGGDLWAVAGGPAISVVLAVVGLVLVAATAPFWEDGPSSGPGWESAGPSS